MSTEFCILFVRGLHRRIVIQVNMLDVLMQFYLAVGNTLKHFRV